MYTDKLRSILTWDYAWDGNYVYHMRCGFTFDVNPTKLGWSDMYEIRSVV